MGGLRRVETAVLFGEGASGPLWDSLRGRVTCLLYHRIARHTDAPWLEHHGVPVTPPEVLERHLREIVRHGARFFSLDEIANGEFPDPRTPGFVVTFDDGFRDSFDAGRPVLEKAGVRAVFFVTTAFVEPTVPPWEHRLALALAMPTVRGELLAEVRRAVGADLPGHRLRWALMNGLNAERTWEILARVSLRHGLDQSILSSNLYPTWETVREALRSGHQVGSHGVDHVMRHLLNREDMYRQLALGRATLERELGIAPTAFSFPFNAYLLGDAELCRKAGYRQVVTVDRGRMKSPEGLGWVPRLTIHAAHDWMPAFRRLLLEERPVH